MSLRIIFLNTLLCCELDRRNKMLKLEFEGITYPYICESVEGFEVFITLIPEPTGDYFKAKIDSCGGYNILDFVAKEDVKIIAT